MLEEARLIELVKQHLQINISTDLSDWSNVDCRVYNEQTADGYDLWVVTNEQNHPIICEDVYYYDHDVANAVREQMRYGDTTFYIDECVYEDCYIEDMLVQTFVDYVDEIIKDAESGETETNITLKELEILKEEYDLEEERADIA
tara:strand:+ start:1011 stop:1445 length:435 start_codon:yes stop_codon:yes gene_type:complete